MDEVAEDIQHSLTNNLVEAHSLSKKLSKVSLKHINSKDFPVRGRVSSIGDNDVKLADEELVKIEERAKTQKYLFFVILNRFLLKLFNNKFIDDKGKITNRLNLQIVL